MANATLINVFEVPDAVSDKEFVARWVRTRDFLNTRVGPIQTALHSAMSPDARFRFVNVAQIEDVDAWRAALSDPGSRAAMGNRRAQTSAPTDCGGFTSPMTNATFSQ